MQQPDLSAVQWTGAIICQQDRIFPAENQQRFWQGYFAARPGAIRLLDLPHYPFHQFNDCRTMLTPHKARVAQRFSQSLTTL